MLLTPMRYKEYVWPHNPRVYSIDYERIMAVNKVPFGLYYLQDLGRTRRVMKGEGEETFAQLLQVLVEKEGSGASFSGYLEEIKQKGIPGLVFLDSQGNKDGAAWGTFAGGDRQAGWPVYDTGIRPPWI